MELQFTLDHAYVSTTDDVVKEESERVKEKTRGLSCDQSTPQHNGGNGLQKGNKTPQNQEGFSGHMHHVRKTTQPLPGPPFHHQTPQLQATLAFSVRAEDHSHDKETVALGTGCRPGLQSVTPS